MPTDRRDHSARSLRQLFQEQLARLSQRLLPDNAERQRRAEREQALDQAIAALLKGAHGTLPNIPHYTDHLRGAVHQLLDHLNTLVDAIPETVHLSREDFNTNPYLHAFFVNSEEMLRTISFHPEMRHYLKHSHAFDAPTIYALLCVSKKEKKTFGVDLSGDTLMHDVPRTHVNFENHQVHFVCNSDACLRHSLRQCLFDSYVNMVHQKMGAESEHLASEPMAYLQRLSELLSQPQQYLSVERNSLRINRMGLLLGKDAKGHASEIEINEVELDKAPFRVILPVCIQRAELLEPGNYLDEASRLLQG